MGESMVEAQNIENKMRESVASRETLGVSVSFGKYENDSLSWEKWSTFSPNKYLDEVGKCSTPGSVAQKKAFFEAHYKKIAAMKAEAEAEAEAELLNRQKATETTGPSRSDDYIQENIVEIKNEHENGIESKASVDDEEPTIEGSGKCENENAEKEEATSVKDESTIASNTNCDKSEDDISVKDANESTIELNTNGDKLEDAISVKDENFEDESTIELNTNGDKLEDAISVKDENFEDESMIKLNNNGDNLQDAVLVKDESFQDESIPVSKVLNINGKKLDEAVLVNDESIKLVKQHFKVDLEDTKQETPKPKPKNVAKKVNPIKKKPSSLIPKTPETSSARLIKPKATSTPKANATSSLSKKANATSSLSSKKATNATSASSSKSIRTAPMSLHLSMSMNSVTSDTASSVTSSRRRSLFMEQMGDKDIVRRAFKTFQNRINEIPISDIGIKQIPIKESESKASTSMASQKENEFERSRKASEKINPARGRLGPTWKSESSGSLKGVSVDERRPNATSSSSSVVLKSTERADRRKAFFKNLEEKSNAREAERSQINSRSKEVKDAEMKKFRQNLSFKAKPMPSFYKAQGVSKSTSDKKESIKNGTQRRPASFT